MKIQYFSMMAAAAMLLTVTSCSQEEDFSPSADEKVTFSINLEGASMSRLAGEGLKVDQLYYEVYQGNTKLLDNFGDGSNAQPVAIEDGKATVEMSLMKGEKYDIIFWAQNGNAGIYNADNLKEIIVDYTNASSNVEEYDAFFYGEKGFQVTNSVNTIKLNRPFAQLNVGTTSLDWNTASDMTIAEGDPVTQSEMVVEGLADTFNALDGKATGSQTVTFQKADLLKNGDAVDTFEVKKKAEDGTEVTGTYYYLSMNYLLVPTNESNHKSSTDVTATFWRTGKDDALFSVTLPNVPIERNWRTNILGNILAANEKFEIVVDPIFKNDYNYPSKLAEEIALAAQLGGEITLTEDVELTRELFVQYDLIINLNGKKLTGSVDDILFRVQNGATLTINGEGNVETLLYVASANEGGTIVVNGGNYISGTTCFQANGGEVYIKGGTFDVTDEDKRYLLNHIDSKKNEGLIEVTGGKFKGYNPESSNSENPAMNFLPEGYSSLQEGEYFVVVGDIVLYEDHADVYSAKGLLKWGYLVNKVNNELSLNIMRDIDMPALTIAEDEENQTYVFTETAITVTDNNKPSGSNWIPVRNHTDCNGKYFAGVLDGKDNAINGLLINYDKHTAGFIGYLIGHSTVKNLILNNSVIYSSASYVGGVVGYAQNGTLVENVHVKNTIVSGAGNVGGVVGYNYSKTVDISGNVFNEDIAVISNCTTDENTAVNGTGNQVGGICGTNYGAVVVNCVNNADVTGVTSVGGVVGYTREYYATRNGYVIASGSTEKAIIASINEGDNSVGGIVGHTLKDNEHQEYSYIVACYSASEVKKTKYTGAMIGVATNAQITASWAVKNGSSKIVGTTFQSEFTPTAAYLYDVATDIEQANVDAMNVAIDAYNALEGIEYPCDYKWQWTEGSWPSLVSVK